MARQLWLLRHGEAEPHGARPDPERRLTAARRGAVAARRAARSRRSRSSFQARLHAARRCARATRRGSPARRSASSRWCTRRCARASTPTTRSRCCRTARRARPARRPRARLLPGRARPHRRRIDLKKGGVAAVRLDGAHGELIVLLRPAELDAARVASTGCPSCPRSRSPRAAWTRRCAAPTIESTLAPGINALKTFDPPLHALDGRTIDGRAPPRQAPGRRRRRATSSRARAPDVRRAAAALRQARRRCATAPRAC